MSFHPKLRQIGLTLLGLAIGWPTPQADAQVRPTRITINVTNNDIFLLVKIPRRRYSRIVARNWHPTVRLWVRQTTGWSQVGIKAMQTRQYSRALSRNRICRHAHGKVKMVLQLGIRTGQVWWNRFTRTWQRDFISLQQQVAYIPCTEVPDDWPPGSPAQPSSATEPPPTEDLPPAQPPTPTPPPVHADPGQQPADPPQPSGQPPAEPPQAPPPPPVVDDSTFQTFHQSLKDNSFDNNRYTMLRNWLSRLNQLKLKPTQIHSLLATFSFDNTRLKASRLAAAHVLRPLRVADVIEIIRGFSFGSHKLKAAFYYCQGLQDGLNINQLANQFTFSGERTKIMQGCR